MCLQYYAHIISYIEFTYPSLFYLTVYSYMYQTDYDPALDRARYSAQLYTNGTQYPIQLFLDFDDWRMGTRGVLYSEATDAVVAVISMGSNNTNTSSYSTNSSTGRSGYVTVRGAHFSAFSDPSITTIISNTATSTTTNTTTNNSTLHTSADLVYDRILQSTGIDNLHETITDLYNNILWLVENRETYKMDATRRSRRDVGIYTDQVIHNLTSLYTDKVNDMYVLNSTWCVGHKIDGCILHFNTSDATVNGIYNSTGYIKHTDNGTEVAVYIFDSIYLGPEVNVTVCGQRPLALVSRSSAVLNTSIIVLPGTLGGFQGGQSVGIRTSDVLVDTPSSVYICDLTATCTHPYEQYNTSTNLHDPILSKNVNGPGSGSIAIKSFIIQTSAAQVNEVQMIRTTASPGQTLAGSFVLSYRDYTTPLIPYSTTAGQLKRILEDNLNAISPLRARSTPLTRDRPLSQIGIGSVWVTRSAADSEGGCTWNITFASTRGPVELLQGVSYLQGIGARLDITQVQSINLLGGSFALTYYNGLNTDTLIIPYNATVADLSLQLLSLPGVVTARVLRTDSVGNCIDGFCADGPGPGGGLTWTVYVGIQTDALDALTSPTSPLSPVPTNDTIAIFTVDSADLTGVGAAVSLSYALLSSPDGLASELATNSSFHLAYGGAGGSYGGLGGDGYGGLPTGPIYNTPGMTDLLGGSGGCLGGTDVFVINSVQGIPMGRGGSGGGAVEITATNDVTIGVMGVINLSGEDGTGSSHGGGGGGSGGSVLIAAGGSVVIEGSITAKGGRGGHSGVADSETGGGGGGGRIALYGSTILQSNSSLIDVSGGLCGGPLSLVFIPAVSVNISLVYRTVLPLELAATGRLVLKTLTLLFKPLEINIVNQSVTGIGQNYGDLTSYQITVNITLPVVASNMTQTILSATDLLTSLTINSTSSNSMSSYKNVASLLLYDFTVESYFPLTISRLVADYICSVNRSGQSGTVFLSPTTTATGYVRKGGSEGTNNAYYISTRHLTSNLGLISPYIPFNSSHPSKVTFYVKIDSSEGAYLTSTYGILFALTSTTVHSNTTSNNSSSTNSSSNNTSTNNIGVFLGQSLSYGANIRSIQEIGGRVIGDANPANVANIANIAILLDTWSKVSILIDWSMMTFTVSLNDTIYGASVRFNLSNLNGLRITPTIGVAAYVDEVYVGFDQSLGYRCPVSTPAGVVGTYDCTLTQSASAPAAFAANPAYHKMVRHYNFLPVQSQLAFDGQGMLAHTTENSALYPSDVSLPSPQGSIPASKLVSDPINERVRYLYSHYVYPTTSGFIDSEAYGNPQYDMGHDAVVVCSTPDGQTWEYQGVALESINMTDTIFGTPGPFLLQRPAVVYNNLTGNYVLWVNMDDLNRTLSMAAVAYSPYPNGPFLFTGSIYPDGNRTHDQTLTTSKVRNMTSLVRSYDYEVEYVKPRAISQPVWESVKHNNGSVNYRVNYHRAYYAVEYDNYHDIYLQRWRLEDKPYNIQCKNKITGLVRQAPPACIYPDETELVLGLGQPPVLSRYVSPADPENSWWMPNSETSVRAQPWYQNYIDGLCGIHKLDEGYNTTDPSLASFKPYDRHNCSNIADNPPHIAAQDVLLGPQYVAYTRTARFAAVSRLTPDFMDTSGDLYTVEGGVDAQRGLTSIMSGFEDSLHLLEDTSDVSHSNILASTFIPPLSYATPDEGSTDWSLQFQQYVISYGDRSRYSLACMVDGVCPVDFKAQILTVEAT